jgi:hypothetical protein
VVLHSDAYHIAAANADECVTNVRRAIASREAIKISAPSASTASSDFSQSRP